MPLTYTRFNRHYLFVCCDDKDKYSDYMVPLDGEWYTKEDVPGFLIPIEKEKQLAKLIEFINIRENGCSRKEQKKYHRSVSDSEEDDDDEEGEYEEDKIEETKDKKVFRKTPLSKKKYDKSDPKEYYKSFNAKPADFAKLNKIDSYSDLEGYSSSSRGSSSTDNFPEPNSPRPKKHYDIDGLFETVSELKQRIRNLESKNK
jgi:hypothetical protein